MEHDYDFEEKAQDFFPFFRVCKDGHVERYILTTQVDSGFDPFTGVVTKDIVLLTDPKISGRIFLPKMDDTDSDDDSPRCRKSLPVLFHCHGGGFCTGSAFGPIIKQFLSNLVSTTQVIAITIDYRLAPEHPLPIAYDDCWAAFKWVASHVNGNGPDPCLNEYADFSRVILCGESTGANLAHEVAVRASAEPLEGLNLESLLAIHPYFAGKRHERVIEYLYPSDVGMNYEPKLNPNLDPRLYKLSLDKILICVAEKDIYKDRGYNYYTTLKTRWVGTVELMETLGESHCFHLLDATSPNIDPLMSKLTSFIKEERNLNFSLADYVMIIVRKTEVGVFISLNLGFPPQYKLRSCGMLYAMLVLRVRGRGVHYKEALLKCGCKARVEVVETLGEGHCLSFVQPSLSQCWPISFMDKVVAFLNAR